MCDVYDAITSVRPYKDGWDPAEAIASMAQWSRRAIRRRLFQAFVAALGIYPIGSLVRLHSGRLAVVLDQNPSSLVAPLVKAFYSTRSRMPLPVQVVDLGRKGCDDWIVGRESNAVWKFAHLADLITGHEAMSKRAPAR